MVVFETSACWPKTERVSLYMKKKFQPFCNTLLHISDNMIFERFIAIF